MTAERVVRGVQLHRMKKAELIRRIRAFNRVIWTAAPLERWSKDDLVSELLDLEAKS